MTQRNLPVLQATLRGMMYILSVRVILPGIMAHALVAASFRPGTPADECHPIQIWHQRLCHINYAAIKKLATSDSVDGIQLLTDHQFTDLFCEGCCKGKQHRTPFPVNEPRIRALSPRALLHADLMGPIHPASVGGALYCLLICNDATGYRIAFCLSRKSDTLSCIKQAVRQTLRDTGCKVQVIRTDCGGEFINKETTNYYDLEMIRQELTAPYNPEQNGAAKHDNRTVMELVGSMIHSNQTPSHFWAEATQTAVYVLNRTLSRTLPRTPYESWFGKKPSLSHLRIFGCPAFIYAEKHTHTKLDPKSRPGLFMGYADESKAYQVWDLTKSKIVITRDVIFHKTPSTPHPSSSTASSASPILPASPLSLYTFPKINIFLLPQILAPLSLMLLYPSPLPCQPFRSYPLYLPPSLHHPPLLQTSPLAQFLAQTLSILLSTPEPLLISSKILLTPMTTILKTALTFNFTPVLFGKLHLPLSIAIGHTSLPLLTTQSSSPRPSPKRSPVQAKPSGF
jgi:hypothetical protein